MNHETPREFYRDIISIAIALIAEDIFLANDHCGVDFACYYDDYDRDFVYDTLIANIISDLN